MELGDENINSQTEAVSGDMDMEEYISRQTQENLDETSSISSCE